WIRDGELLIATDVGILSVDTLGNVETHRCYTDEPWRARHATEPRIVASRVRERLSLYRAEVDACFGALPDPKTLPGAPEYHLDASLLLILHRDGTVKEARPRGWGPPGVGRCIAG